MEGKLSASDLGAIPAVSCLFGPNDDIYISTYDVMLLTGGVIFRLARSPLSFFHDLISTSRRDEYEAFTIDPRPDPLTSTLVHLYNPFIGVEVTSPSRSVLRGRFRLRHRRSIKN